MNREQILNEARKCVCEDRNNAYGEPENSFPKIAKLWQAYLGTHISPADVAVMMALLKIARISNGGTLDSFVDGCGYFACGGELFCQNQEIQPDGAGVQRS